MTKEVRDGLEAAEKKRNILGPNRRMNMRRHLAIFVLMVVIGALAVNVWIVSHYDPRVERHFSVPAKAKAFTGKLDVNLQSPLIQQGTLSADVVISFTVPDSRDISYVRVSYGWEKKGHRFWKSFTREAMDFSELGPRSDLVEIRDKLKLPFTAFRPPVTYPFDEYGSDLDVAVCVNNGGNPCSGGSNFSFSGVTVNCNPCRFDPALTPVVRWSRPSAFSVTLRRQAFFRIVSIALFLLSVIFLFLIVKSYESTELLKGALGYFGAIWALRSLIVPKDMPTFPTVVEYSALTLYLALSCAIIVKIIERRKSDEKDSSMEGLSGTHS